MEEFDEAERILTELRGSLAANPRVGVLLEDRADLRLATDAPLHFANDLPEVLQSAVERLKAAAAQEPELAERALHHLYRLVRRQ